MCLLYVVRDPGLLHRSDVNKLMTFYRDHRAQQKTGNMMDSSNCQIARKNSGAEKGPEFSLPYLPLMFESPNIFIIDIFARDENGLSIEE